MGLVLSNERQRKDNHTRANEGLLVMNYISSNEGRFKKAATAIQHLSDRVNIVIALLCLDISKN